MKLPFAFPTAVICLLLTSLSPAFSFPTVFPGGTTLYEPEAAYNSYILFCPLEAAGDLNAEAGAPSYPVYLINMSGVVVHQWKVPFVPMHGRLLPNGNVIILGLSPVQVTEIPRIRMKNFMGGYADRLLELDWDGKTVFQIQDPNMHHDFARLPNGNTMYVAWEPVPRPLHKKVRGGMEYSEHLFNVPDSKRKEYFTKRLMGGEGYDVMFSDYLVEVNPQGKKVWEWHANQHLDPNIDIIGPLYKREEWLHTNSVTVLKDGNVAISCRNTDTIYIIDKNSGKILLRWGTVAHLSPGSQEIKYRLVPSAPFSESKSPTLGGPHNVRQIEAGLPGAGNLTVYNNGVYSGFSKVVEINPVTKQVVWQSKYSSHGRRPSSFILGSAQRLPNGNTLVCEGVNGRFYQLTNDSKIVWEYVNPFSTSTLFAGAVMQIQAYAPDYCAQFKSLPAAKGAAVIPAKKPSPGSSTPGSDAPATDGAETSTGDENAEAAASAILRYQMAVAALLVAVALLAYLWRRSAARGA